MNQRKAYSREDVAAQYLPSFECPELWGRLAGDLRPQGCIPSNCFLASCQMSAFEQKWTLMKFKRVLAQKTKPSRQGKLWLLITNMQS